MADLDRAEGRTGDSLDADATEPNATSSEGGVARRGKPRRRTPQERAPTATFTGNLATVMLPEPATFGAVEIDGRPIATGKWKVTGPQTLRVECPPNVFDARPHVLQLMREGVTEPLSITFASNYHGAIDHADEGTVRGWLHDTLRPGTAVHLEIRSGDGDPFEIVCNAMRSEASESAQSPKDCGFAAMLPPRVAAALPELLTITVKGSAHRPFQPLLRGASLPAAVHAASAASLALSGTATGLLLSTSLMPALVRSLGGGDGVTADMLSGTFPLADARILPRSTAPTVDVIIPVYRGETETLTCINSVLASGSRIGHRVVVIDDCSPEPSLSRALNALAQDGRITYLRNLQNLGYVGSINRGIAMNPEADVLLLNADTVVPPGFLDRLYCAAYSDARIATATPLSNHATIFSLPTIAGSARPWQLDTAELDVLCEVANAGKRVDVPTAHGFCMYVKRAALQDVGLFDVDAFGAGYGEENDFSQRAWLRGWRNVAAADVFVSHVGSVSFGAARDELIGPNLQTLLERHPHYQALVDDFFRTDPLHEMRNGVQKALWRRHARIAVVITLGVGGGTEQHAEALMQRLTDEGWLVLVLSRHSGDTRAVRLARWRSDEALLYPATARLAERLADMLDLAPKLIHLQHVIDLPDGVAEFVRDSGIPYAVTLHDFFYGCPKVTMLDAGSVHCGMPPVAKCAVCVTQGPIHSDIHPSLRGYAEFGEVWRAKWDGLLRDAAQVIAPSNDTAERYARMFPGLAVTVRPHFAPTDRQHVRSMNLPPVEAGLRVALIGALGPQKGAAQLVDLARHCTLWHDDLRFVLVGHSDREEELNRYPNVDILGAYKPPEVQAHLARAQCHVALFLSVFPETFCYTLSEALEAGLVPVAYDFGALGERLRGLQAGVLVPVAAPPEQVVAAIRQAAGQRLALPPTAPYAHYDTLMADYYAPALADLIDASPPPDTPRLIGVIDGVHADHWCDGEVAFDLWHAEAIARISLAFWLPPDAPPQAVEVVVPGAQKVRSFLQIGEVARVVVHLSDGMRHVTVRCRFDFVYRLASPDVRSCAAVLHQVAVAGASGGWQPIDLSTPMPHRTA